MQYDTLKFYLETESDFEEWLEEAHLNGIELTRVDGMYPDRFPVLVLAPSLFYGNHVVSAEAYYVYPEDMAGSCDTKNDTERLLMNSAKEFKEWRRQMADDDILLSFNQPGVSRPLKYPCLVVCHEKWNDDGADHTEVMFAYKEDFSNP